jgi:uncharacterized protein DUF6111
MLRVFLTIVLPLVAPTALYLVWVRFTHWSRGGSQPSETMRWAALPWLWLAGSGALLLAIVLFVVTVHFGAPQSGVYVPPRWEGGRIIPGHIEPGRSP